jgi:hypothetical protein
MKGAREERSAPYNFSCNFFYLSRICDIPIPRHWKWPRVTEAQKTLKTLAAGAKKREEFFWLL